MPRMPWETDNAGLSDEIEDASYTLETPWPEKTKSGMEHTPQEEDGRDHNRPSDRETYPKTGLIPTKPKIPSGASQADIYMVLAPEVIRHVLSCRERAVEWWIMEEKHRAQYALTPEQEAMLIGMLKERFPKAEPASDG